MSRKDGSPTDETTRFWLGGAEHEIDLRLGARLKIGESQG